jgi:gluconolactonase
MEQAQFSDIDKIILLDKYVGDCSSKRLRGGFVAMKDWSHRSLKAIGCRVMLTAACLAAAGVYDPIPSAFAAQPSAPETELIAGIAGPEGPVLIGHDLYYVGWTDSNLWKWDGRKSTLLHHDPSCTHNGLALTKANTFLLACLANPGAILELRQDGHEIRRWTTDKAGRKLQGGVNDFAVLRNGAAYATLSGDFAEPPGRIEGKVLYLAPGANQWVEVAADLNYANGLAVSPDMRTLYVSETVGNHIVKFTIGADGSLTDRSNFAFLHLLTPDKVRSAWIGPDGLKVDRQGNIYAAQFSGGKILKLSSTGALLHEIPITHGDGVTNLALSDDERTMVVTVVRDPGDPKAIGSIVRIPNP